MGKIKFLLIFTVLIVFSLANAQTPSSAGSPLNYKLLTYSSRFSLGIEDNSSLGLSPWITNHKGDLEVSVNGEDGFQGAVVFIHKLGSTKVTRFYFGNTSGWGAAFTPDDKYVIFTNLWRSKLYTVNIATGKLVTSDYCWDRGLELDNPFPSYGEYEDGGYYHSTGLQFSNDGSILYRSEGANLLVEDTKTCKVIQSIYTGSEIKRLALYRDIFKDSLFDPEDLIVYTGNSAHKLEAAIYSHLKRDKSTCGLSGSAGERVADCGEFVKTSSGSRFSLVSSTDADVRGFRLNLWQDSKSGTLFTTALRKKDSAPTYLDYEDSTDFNFSLPEATAFCEQAAKKLNFASGLGKVTLRLPLVSELETLSKDGLTEEMPEVIGLSIIPSVIGMSRMPFWTSESLKSKPDIFNDPYLHRSYRNESLTCDQNAYNYTISLRPYGFGGLRVEPGDINQNSVCPIEGYASNSFSAICVGTL